MKSLDYCYHSLCQNVMTLSSFCCTLNYWNRPKIFDFLLITVFYLIFKQGPQHHWVHHGSLGQPAGHGSHWVEAEELTEGRRQYGKTFSNWKVEGLLNIYSINLNLFLNYQVDLVCVPSLSILILTEVINWLVFVTLPSNMHFQGWAILIVANRI